MTKEQAMNVGYGHEIHYTGRHDCTKTVGPRGGVTINITRVRKSGKCKTWVTRPLEFSMPVKYGLYESAYIDHNNCNDFHLASECTLDKE